MMRIFRWTQVSSASSRCLLIGSWKGPAKGGHTSSACVPGLEESGYGFPHSNSYLGVPGFQYQTHTFLIPFLIPEAHQKAPGWGILPRSEGNVCCVSRLQEKSFPLPCASTDNTCTFSQPLPKLLVSGFLGSVPLFSPGCLNTNSTVFRQTRGSLAGSAAILRK